MILQKFMEKKVDGNLGGLILEWNCAHCQTANITWLTRTDAKIGEKRSHCLSCLGKNLVNFISSEVMSERELIVQQARPFIPTNLHESIYEDLAWTELFFVSGGNEKKAERNWRRLKTDLDYWIQQDQYKQKNLSL
jgi:hypothetical protein